MPGLPRRLAAEAIGTALLVAAIVGSAIMAQGLTDDRALALLCNALATGAALMVLITIFAPISGAHFNPAVTLVLLLQRQMRPRDAALYLPAQILGGIAGTLLAHAMFAQPLLEASAQIRTGSAQWLAEAVATCGLVTIIIAAPRREPSNLAALVGLYIAAAYWFTASTSFANPAVTIARSFTQSMAGIRWLDTGPFILAQLVGAALALGLGRWLFGSGRS
ncbi:MAG TPA: MIP/aquaporin family protein [Devosia sp.]|nr:MIP/aquaporin family protein [Devosia sp.]